MPGVPFRFQWGGGALTGAVSLALRVNNAATALAGYNMPLGKITNTGSFDWTVPIGFPSSSSVQLIVLSREDPTNYAVSAPFAVEGVKDGG